ncbi:MAG: AAA family ATPase [Candidatus Bathyarchaeota archaeon]|nr:AAA family ATPase [Candidatus Bathyarchaeota archaeon]
MIIKRIEIQNIRSHLSSKVEFNEGFNCMVGGVGTGKTSILLSLHFALFGEPLYKDYGYLLREDKNSCKVSVEFEHLGKMYKIVRGLKREKGGRITQDSSTLTLSENGKLLAWGKILAVQEQLKNIIGIDKKMFEEFVWIQQEKLKEILNMTPRERQNLLDELFGFTEFYKAWEILLQYKKHYDAIRATLEKDPDVVGFTELKNQYDKLLVEYVNLQSEIENLKGMVVEAEKEFKDAEESLKSLEALERKIEVLKEEKLKMLTLLGENAAYIENSKKQIEDKNLEIENYRNSLEKIKNEKEKILGNFHVKSLIELKSLIERLDKESSNIKNEFSSLKGFIDNAKKSLTILENEDICPTCRRKIESFERYKMVNQIKTEYLNAQQKLLMLESMLNDVEFKLKSASEAKNRVELLEFKISEVEKLLSNKEKELNKLKDTVNEKLRFQENLLSKLKDVENEISMFNVGEVEDARKVREEKLLKYRNILTQLEHQEEMVKEKLNQLEIFEKRFQTAREKIGQKNLAEKVCKVVDLLRFSYKEVVPLLRQVYIDSLRETIQSVMDSLTLGSERSFYVEIDEEYTPVLVDESGFRRSVNHISGGERTWLALAYRVGLGRLIMEAKTGQSFELLILDEPTEALGKEDGSIEALAKAMSNLKIVRQILAVTHSEELAKEASTKILVLKRNNISFIEKL